MSWHGLFTVILLNDGSLPDLALARESFNNQSWPHRELLLSDEGVPLSVTSQRAHGEYCVVWRSSLAQLYASDCLLKIAQCVAPRQLTVLRCYGQQVASAFFRRAAHLLESDQLEVVDATTVAVADSKPKEEPVASEERIRRRDRALDGRIKVERLRPESALVKTQSHVWLNNAIAVYRGRRLMTYRSEHQPYWQHSQIGICECYDNWVPVPKTAKTFACPRAEDARLFVHEGDLYMPYTDNKFQLLSKLRDDLAIDWIRQFTEVPGVVLQAQEKNWSFFSHWSGIHAVYSINPHSVLAYRDGQLRLCAEQAWTFHWPYGELRGGAPPVLFQGLYWHWFHSSHRMAFGRDDCRWNLSRRYHVGVYAFEAKPPFRPVACVRWPVISGADRERRSMPGINRPSEHAVVFPCGAVRTETGWWLSYGENDIRCCVAFVPDSVVFETLIWL